jgi:hypothetical protein
MSSLFADMAMLGYGGPAGACWVAREEVADLRARFRTSAIIEIEPTLRGEVA